MGQASRQRKKFSRKSRIRRWLWYMFSILLWVALFFGGLVSAKNFLADNQAYLDQRIDDVQKQNEAILAEITRFNEEAERVTEELSFVKNELNVIKEELELTGETMTGSDQTKQALQERMTELDQRLNELKAQLIKLEEAARAY